MCVAVVCGVLQVCIMHITSVCDVCWCVCGNCVCCEPATQRAGPGYGVATISRIDEITGLFCRILSLL